MSEQDRFDWNDDVEFGQGSSDMEDGDCFESSLEGFDDFDDMSDFESEDPGMADSPADDSWPEQANVASDESGPEDKKSEDPQGEDKRAPMRNMITVKRRSGISAMGMGFLFAASIMVAGIGVGGAVLFAEGVNPASLWQPQEMLKIDQLLNFSEHPLNIIYMVSLGITFLALLGSYRMGKVAVESNSRTRAAEEMLDRMCALRLDEQDAWRDEQFKAFPPAEEFAIKTLGAWRLQEARQKRLMGIEGEIHRLEKALAGDSRTDLTGRYDNPAVGRLVDEMLRHFDARDAAVKKAAEVEKRDEDAGQDILDSVHETCAWNWRARTRVEEGGIEATRLADALNILASDVHETSTRSGDNTGVLDVLSGVRSDLTSLVKTSRKGGTTTEVHGELNDLVDRGSKLAFQIAMEVTRLGPRGERLLPMSKTLEDLTTDFRKAIDSLPAGEADDSPDNSAVSSVSAKLDTLEELFKAEMETDHADLSGPISKAAPVAARLAEDLAGLAEDFNGQGDRLNEMGTAVADLSGQTFEPESAPEPKSSLAEVEPLVLDRQEPKKTSRVTDADHEPFVDHSRGFTLDPEPVLETPLSGDGETVYDQDVEGASDEEVFELETFGAAPVEAPLDTPEAELDSVDEEPVYDLDQFAAEPLETAAPGAGAEETVYDLDAFGAAPMDIPAEDAGADEPVFEMSDLGGETIQDEVLDLESFGALPLDDADEAEDQEDVFDLNQFGAKSLD